MLRPREAWQRLGCGATKFYQHYIGKGLLRLVDLGPNSRGVPDDEVDDLIDALVDKRDATPNAFGVTQSNDKTEKIEAGSALAGPASADSEASPRLASRHTQHTPQQGGRRARTSK